MKRELDKLSRQSQNLPSTTLNEHRRTRPSVSELISLIYDASLDANAWDTFLEKFADSVRGTTTALIYYDTSRREGNCASAVRVDPDLLRAYNEYFVGKDVWAAGAANSPAGRIFSGDELCPSGELTRSEFYNDYLRPIHAFHEIGTLVLKGGPILGCLTTLRPKNAGSFGMEEIGLLEQLLPHLQRALQIHRRLVGLEGQLRAASDVLDRFPVGVILLDSKGRILCINIAAKNIADEADGLRLTKNGLVAALASENSLMQKLISESSLTSQAKDSGAGGVLKLSRPSMKTPLEVLVAPFPRAGFEINPERPTAAVFVSDPARSGRTNDIVLRQLFGLTKTESKVATLLMEGKSLGDVSSELQISGNTARTHLKRILDKSGTHRQGELIRLLLTGPAGLRAEGRE